MHAITTGLVVLLAVVVSGFVVGLPRVRLPLPLVQIGLGAALSSLAGFEVPLDPSIFFLLFVPPLLFLDGWRIPNDAFFRDIRTILMQAIGLVFFTTLGAGLLIGWLLPAVPMAVAFALAAILSPTDPVAVAAIAARTPIPARLMRLLEGESLLNDASGLVSFRFAVAAAVTGSFSLAQASMTFVLVALGGFVTGMLVCLVIGAANRWLVRKLGEEADVQILISLLIPFAAYLSADKIGASGILAAATAGITMQWVEFRSRLGAVLRMRRSAVWDSVQMALNGGMFVLLGEQLPGLLHDAPVIAADARLAGAWTLPGYVVAITLGMAVLRFAWVYTSLRLTLFRERPRMDGTSFMRVVWLGAFAGVRGAITLAGILTLPLVLPGGELFPARSLVILLAMGVILLSLILATVALPLLARGLRFAPDVGVAEHQREAEARAAAAEAAIARVEALRAQSRQSGDEDAAAARVIELYRRRLRHGRHGAEDPAEVRRSVEAERNLRLAALRAERDTLHELRAERRLDDVVYRKLTREIDLMEAAISAR
jgi:CPA1 family monovalent cation:H+ antiporter